MLARLKNGALAVLITCVAQLLITLIERLLDQINVDFPSSIVAMALVFGVFSIAAQLFPSVDSFYQQHLRCPVSLRPFHVLLVLRFTESDTTCPG